MSKQKIKIEKQVKNILEILRKRKWYIGIMESCTGGAIINSITNIPGASDVFKCGKVTYSDEAKIEAGVDRKVIDRYGVFSIEVAKEMARKIDGNIGIGVTGNLPGEVFVAVRIESKFWQSRMVLKSDLENKIKARIEMKREVVEKVMEKVLQLIS
jgi:PncC family amidohydrolase